MRRFETYTVPSPQIVGSTEARAWREYRELPWYKRWYFHVRAVFTGRPVPELVFDAMLEAMTNEINLEHAGLVWGNPAMVGDRLFGPIRRLALTAARLRPLIGSLLSARPERFLVFLAQRHVPELDAALAADMGTAADEWITAAPEGTKTAAFFDRKLRERLTTYHQEIEDRVKPLWTSVAVLHAAVVFSFDRLLPRAESSERAVVVPLRAMVSGLAQLLQLCGQFRIGWNPAVLEDIEFFIADLSPNAKADLSSFIAGLESLSSDNRLSALLAIGIRDPFVEVRVPPPSIDWYDATIDAWVESLIPRAVQSVLSRRQRMVAEALRVVGVELAGDSAQTQHYNGLPNRALKAYLSLIASKSFASDVRAVLQLIIEGVFASSQERDSLHHAAESIEAASRLLTELFVGVENGPPALVPHQIERMTQSESGMSRRAQIGLFVDGIRARLLPVLHAMNEGMVTAGRIVATRKQLAESGPRITYRNGTVLGVEKARSIDHYLERISASWSSLGDALTQLLSAELEN